jgi:hypothetical protein
MPTAKMNGWMPIHATRLLPVGGGRWPLSDCTMTAALGVTQGERSRGVLCDGGAHLPSDYHSSQ